MRFLTRKSFGSTLLALLALAAQLAFSTVGAVADAREPNSVQVHWDGPHQHHASHNPDTCVFCLAFHAPGTPAAGDAAPIAALETTVVAIFESSTSYSHAAASLQTARAPPALV